MKLILNLLLLFIAFALVRRAVRRFLTPAKPQSPPPTGSQQRRTWPGERKHPALRDDEVIEDAEFEELD